MRYERLLRALDLAKIKYEETVHSLLSEAFKSDTKVGLAIRGLVMPKTGTKRGPYKKKRKNPWNDPDYRKRQLKNLAATRAKKNAKA